VIGSMQMGNVDVTVVLPFTDDEDLVGSACQRIAHHLAEQGLVHELIAVDEGSGDNSVALLALLRPTIPELRVLHGASPGRGFALGAAAARGRVLWLIEPDSATRSLAAFGRPYGRITRGELELAVVRGRFALLKRSRALVFLDGVSGNGAGFERRLLKRAQRRHLTVEAYEVGGSRGASGTFRLADRVRWRLALALGVAEPRT